MSEPRDHGRPRGVSDATVAAMGKVSEALEIVERARGRLYDFHQLIGRADRTLGEAIVELDRAGHHGTATRLRREVLGRNVLEGRWTFQVIEEFDDGYWTAFRAEERRARDDLMDGRPHVYEAEMKATEQRENGTTN